jgi:hypothetical protein
VQDDGNGSQQQSNQQTGIDQRHAKLFRDGKNTLEGLIKTIAWSRIRENSPMFSSSRIRKNLDTILNSHESSSGSVRAHDDSGVQRHVASS